MTSSKNPVREFIEILRRIRTGHENLKVSSGIPGFIPGTGERVDAFSTALPWESATPDGLFTLKGDKPENPEELITDPQELPIIYRLRRLLGGLEPEQAYQTLVPRLKKTATNRDFMASLIQQSGNTANNGNS